LKNGKFFTVESSQKASFSQILPLLRHRVAVPGKKNGTGPHTPTCPE